MVPGPLFGTFFIFEPFLNWCCTTSLKFSTNNRVHWGSIVRHSPVALAQRAGAISITESTNCRCITQNNGNTPNNANNTLYIENNTPNIENKTHNYGKTNLKIGIHWNNGNNTPNNGTTHLTMHSMTISKQNSSSQAYRGMFPVYITKVATFWYAASLWQTSATSDWFIQVTYTGNAMGYGSCDLH